MKRLLKSLTVFLMVFAAVGFSSCIMEYPDPASDADTSDEGKMTVRIRINALNTDENSERELMHSIRVVMVNSDGEVELNMKEELPRPSTSYDFDVLALAGEKKFFFIANEESISCINPDGTATPLESILQPFTYGSRGFEDKVNSLYFDKSYFDNPNNPIPLSSQYTITTKPGIQEYDFWLVHTATKYTVYFENNRLGELLINDLYITQLYENMYVMPHVGSHQQTIQDLYWIDWLRKVSDESHWESSNQGDANFNDKYGWLTDYSVPGESQFGFYLLKDSEFNVPGLQTSATSEAEPGRATLGPLYSTEGKNLIPGNSEGYQQYILNLKLTDKSNNQEFSAYRTLPNLSALFRNTHVIIHVTFDESYMHIYGEIIGWEESHLFGGVTEEK